MSTDKPRFSVTFTDDSFSKIQKYKKENNISTQSKTVAHLVRLALDDLEKSGVIKNAPSYTEEALKLAEDYDSLDRHGKRMVRLVTDEEKVRCKEEKNKSEVPKAVKMPKPRKNGNMVEIKVFDEPAAAGLGNYLDEPDYHIEQYPEHILPSGTDFGVRIDGDSMEPKIHDGFTVFVKSMSIIDPGQIGIFVLNGKSYCKKLVVDHEKRETRLKSLNSRYEDIVIGVNDFFKTLGHVLGQWGPGSMEDDFLDW